MRLSISGSQVRISLTILNQLNPTLAGPLVYFQATVAQMRGRKFLIKRSKIQSRKVPIVLFFSEIFAAEHCHFDRNCGSFLIVILQAVVDQL